MIKPIKVSCIGVSRHSAVHPNKGHVVESEEITFSETPASASFGGGDSGPLSEIREPIVFRTEGDQMGHFKAGKVYDLIFKET